MAGADIISLGGGRDGVEYDHEANFGSTQGIIVNVSTVAISATLNNGLETVQAGHARDLFGTIDTLISVEDIDGTRFNDVIYGNSDDNSLSGFDGADIIHGGAGNDNIRGDEGGSSSNAADQLFGEDGNDDFKGGAGADLINGGTGFDTINYNLETTFTSDTATHGVIVNMASYNLTGVSVAGIATTNVASGTAIDTRNYVDTLVAIEHIVGTGYNDYIVGSNVGNQLEGDGGGDVIVGGSGADTIDGGAGSDYMVGGLGNDTFYVDNIYDSTIEAVGGGNSDYVYASVNFTASANIDALILTGSANINATGLDAQNDLLIGNSGNNTLDGKSGYDYMIGGLGNDTYYVDNIYDSTIEAVGGGNSDYVYSSVSFTAAANVEALILTGSANINATGINGQVDILVGNNGNNILDGKGGYDYMVGGLGNDTYYVDNIYDSTVEAVGGGTADYVYSSVSFTASANIDGLILTGIANVNATGRDAQVDILVGNSGINTLNALSGNDVLYGGLGNDTFTGGTGADYFVMNYDVAAGQYDIITDFTAGTDYIGLSTTLQGNAFIVDTIYGVDIYCVTTGGAYQVLVTNTHNIAQVTAGIYYYGL